MTKRSSKFIPMDELAARIRGRMADTGNSVNSLAEATAIPRMTLTRRITNPASLTIAEVERLAAALGTSPLYLLTGAKDAA